MTTAERSTVLENAVVAGPNWGGKFRKPDVPHFFQDPGNRQAPIKQAQKDFAMELQMNARLLGNAWSALLLFPIAASAAVGVSIGTYSTLVYNEESGDLNGLEISIVPTDRGLVATVQIAEDGINELHLAKVRESAGSMQFSARLDDGSPVDFSMKCTPKSCSGEYIWGRAKVKFTLRKSHGYWNKKRSL